MLMARLWENTVGWDVLIQCRGYSWRVHRYILCELSPTWMAKYIPPAEKVGFTIVSLGGEKAC